MCEFSFQNGFKRDFVTLLLSKFTGNMFELFLSRLCVNNSVKSYIYVRLEIT